MLYEMKSISVIGTFYSHQLKFYIKHELQSLIFDKRQKIDYFCKNSDYVLMHCPSEHLLQSMPYHWQSLGDKHTSFVPHVHFPFVHVSVAPEQSSSPLHPVVIRIMDEILIAYCCLWYDQKCIFI